MPPILVSLVRDWVEAFRLVEPGIEIDVPPPYQPPQSSLSPRLRAFLEGRLDFAFLSRELSRADLALYRSAHGADPLQIPVGGGSYRHFGFVDAVAVVLNPANPLRALSLPQLDAIFSSSRLRGAEPVETWDQVGVPGWTGRPIHVVGAGAWRTEESARAGFFRRKVMDVAGRNGQWRAQAGRGGGGDEAVIRAVAADPLAIGFTGLGHLVPEVRPIAIASDDKAVPIEPSYEAVADASYPLSRVFYLVVANEPGIAMPAPLAAFTRYLLSRDGQATLASDGVFLPLRRFQVEAALRLLPVPFPSGCGP